MVPVSDPLTKALFPFEHNDRIIGPELAMTKRSTVAFAALALASLAYISGPGTTRADPVTVFGAASVTNALEDIGALYRAEGGDVRFSFASSSTLARQIEAGAPADIFVSANDTWMDYLAERGLIVEETRAGPFGNRLVLIAPSDSTLPDIDISPDLDLSALLGPDNRLAVGDPEHVPAGIYAKQALQSIDLWTALEPRLARADNVRAALALVESGEAPLGIVYATDATVAAGVKVIGIFPRDSHPPITYAIAVVAGSPDAKAAEVKAFFDLMTGPEGLEAFARHGFAVD